jgi:uncharacterized protein
MKNILYLFTLVALQAFPALAQKNFIDQPYVETSAQVDTLVTPDRIYLNILLTEKDTKGRISIEDLESKMANTLRIIGINTERDLTLIDLASNFRKYFLKRQEILKNKAYSLVVQDAKVAGTVILELEKIEVSNVYLDKTEYSKIEQLKLQLKSKAIIEAKQQAEFMVAPLSQKIGAAIYISDQASDNSDSSELYGKLSSFRMRGVSASFDKQEYKPEDIEFEKISVVSAVSVKFKLE